jgi:hypothetical protein
MEQKEHDDRPPIYTPIVDDVVDAYDVPLMDESNTMIVIDDGTNLLFGLSSTMQESKEGMEPPSSLIVCIMCSVKGKEIAELKEKGNEKEKAFKAYIDEMDVKWTMRMESMDAKWSERMEKEKMEMDAKWSERMDTNNAKWSEKMDTNNAKWSEKMDTNNAKWSEKMDKLNEEISSMKKSFTATNRFTLRLLIYDVRIYIRKKLSREPSVGADNTVLWDVFLNSLTPADFLAINMDQGLIQFMQNEMPFCNAKAHNSDKVLVAATLQNMPDSISKRNWITLFSKVYDGESPEDVICRS